MVHQDLRKIQVEPKFTGDDLQEMDFENVLDDSEDENDEEEEEEEEMEEEDGDDNGEKKEENDNNDEDDDDKELNSKVINEDVINISDMDSDSDVEIISSEDSKSSLKNTNKKAMKVTFKTPNAKKNVVKEKKKAKPVALNNKDSSSPIASTVKKSEIETNSIKPIKGKGANKYSKRTTSSSSGNV